MAQINKQADARRIASLMRRIGCIDETIEPAMLGRMQESIAESTRLMNEANTNTTFTMEQQGLIDKLLKRHFGATSSFALCGWILRDGTMLNFSYQNHSRDIDHRYIAQARYDKNDNYLTDFDFPDIYQFCAMGNIRLFPMYGFQIGKRPTPEQQTKLMQFIRRCDELDVDISDESGKIVHTIVPTGRPNASLVLDQINKWFDGQEEMSDADSKQDAAETEDTYQQLCNALSSNKKFSTWDGNDDLICVYNAQVHVRDKGDEISVDEFEPVNKGAYGAEDQFLSDLTKYADVNNKVIVIEMYKSHHKIKAALKRFGFVENKGRNMNYYYNSGVWYRKPRTNGNNAPIGEDRQSYNQYDFVTETRHYPHDIDEILMRGVCLIDNAIRQLITINDTHTYVEDTVDNSLVKRIVYEIYTTSTNRGLLGEYHSNGFDGHKIDTALIVLHVCVNRQGEYSVNEIKAMLSHELTHLLEDNKRQMHKGQSLYGHPKNEILYDLFDNPNIPSELGNLIYLNTLFEKKAFAAQVYHDMDTIECNIHNYKQKATNIMVYKQYTKAFNSFCNFLNDDIHVEALNKLIFSFPVLRQLHIPHQSLDNFNPDTCRTRLKKWAQKHYSDFHHRFWSTVAYYIETHTRQL